MKKAISLILALLAAVGKECYQTFALGLVAAAMTAIVALVCGLSLWTAMPVVALAALGLAHPRRKSPSGETIPRRGGSICRREPRNVALARRRVSRKIKPIT